MRGNVWVEVEAAFTSACRIIVVIRFRFRFSVEVELRTSV